MKERPAGGSIRHNTRLHMCVGVLVLGGIMFAVAPTRADHAERAEGGNELFAEIEWSNPLGGTFAVAGNWSGGVVPGTDDIAVFDLSTSGYTVEFNAIATNSSIVIRTDILTFDLGGFTRASAHRWGI